MKRVAVIVCGTLVMGLGAKTEAIPLANRPSGPGPHLFGYFAGNNQSVGAQNAQCDGGNSSACSALLSDLSSHTNVVQILGTLDWVQARLQAVQAQGVGMGAVVSIFGQFYGATDPNDAITLFPDAASRWAGWVPMLTPFVQSGTIVAFHISEEPRLQYDPNAADPISKAKQTLGALHTITSMVKQNFPNVPVMVDFVPSDLDQGGYSALNPSGFTIPSDIDWVSWDCYDATTTATFTDCFGDLHGQPRRSLPFYMGRLKTILRAGGGVDGQRIVFFPDAWLQANPSAADQSTLLQRNEREASMVENDPSIVMIMPFLWDGSGPGGPGNAGVISMSSVRNYYSAWGKHAASGTARLAYPTNITSNFPSWGTIWGFDYDTNTAWNSQQFYPAGPYLTGTFMDPIRLSQLDLYVDQSPSGAATHLITGGTPNAPPYTLAQVSGTYSDNQLISIPFSPAAITNQIEMQTSNSPSWVAWRDIQPWATGTTRVYAYPAGASHSVTLPEYVSDGDETMVWNAGTAAPAWIELDLGRAQTISLIQLVVEQSPAGTTEHIVFGGPSPNPTTQLAHPIGWTQAGDRINLAGPFPNVRYLRVSTVNSAGSWVAWREIHVFN